MSVLCNVDKIGETVGGEMFSGFARAVTGFVVVAVLGTACLDAQEQTTKILVRVTAHDAKIIGSGVGGARVTVRDVHTGEVLAEGVQQGSTGNTRQIMVEPWRRAGTVFRSEGAASFVAELAVDEPTPVEIVAEGPLGTEHAMQRASKTLLIIPGRDVTGEGIILELMGFTVVIENPADGVSVRAGDEISVRANVTMLCGCPTEPGGMWNADEYEIVVRALRGGKLLAEAPLRYAGTTSTYEGSVRIADAGNVELQVIAMDAARGNFGMARRSVTVTR